MSIVTCAGCGSAWNVAGITGVTAIDALAPSGVIGEPVSRPGDYIEFRAEMDCLVGLSNCPEDALTPCNGRKCTPVKVEVYA